MTPSPGSFIMTPHRGLYLSPAFTLTCFTACRCEPIHEHAVRGAPVSWVTMDLVRAAASSERYRARRLGQATISRYVAWQLTDPRVTR